MSQRLCFEKNSTIVRTATDRFAAVEKGAVTKRENSVTAPFKYQSRKYEASISAVLSANASGNISNAFPTLFTFSSPENPI